MTVKNLTEMLDKGVFNIFITDNEEINIFVVNFVDTKLYFGVHTTPGKSFILIPEKYEEYSTLLCECYSILKLVYKFDGYDVSVKYPSDEYFPSSVSIIGTKVVPTGIIPVSLNSVREYLETEGFKVVSKEDTVSVKNYRDYSPLISRSFEAQERVELGNKVLKGKRLDDKYLAVAEAIKQGEFNLVYIVGPAGTGKTVLAWQLAQYCGAPMLSLQGSEGTTREDLIGYTDVKVSIKTSDDPDSDSISLAIPHDASQYTVIEGLLLKAYREGYHLVIDEANFMLPTVMSVINQMVDDTPTYEFKGKCIKRSPNFVLYLTSNQGYEGTNLYNPATKSRGLTLELSALSKKEFAERLYTNNNKLSLLFYNELYKFQNIVQEYADRWGESSSVCIRHALAFVKLITMKSLDFKDFVEMFKISYLNNALSMDANNAMRIEELISSAELKSALEKLYDLYDYRVIPEVNTSVTLKDALEAFDSDWAEEVIDTKKSIIDDEEFLDTFDEDDFK